MFYKFYFNSSCVIPLLDELSMLSLAWTCLQRHCSFHLSVLLACSLGRCTWAVSTPKHWCLLRRFHFYCLPHKRTSTNNLHLPMVWRSLSYWKANVYLCSYRTQYLDYTLHWDMSSYWDRSWIRKFHHNNLVDTYTYSQDIPHYTIHWTNSCSCSLVYRNHLL